MDLQWFSVDIVRIFIHRKGVFDGAGDNSKTDYLMAPIAVAKPSGRGMVD